MYDYLGTGWWAPTKSQMCKKTNHIPGSPREHPMVSSLTQYLRWPLSPESYKSVILQGTWLCSLSATHIRGIKGSNLAHISVINTHCHHYGHPSVCSISHSITCFSTVSSTHTYAAHAFWFYRFLGKRWRSKLENRRKQTRSLVFRSLALEICWFMTILSDSKSFNRMVMMANRYCSFLSKVRTFWDRFNQGCKH